MQVVVYIVLKNVFVMKCPDYFEISFLCNPKTFKKTEICFVTYNVVFLKREKFCMIKEILTLHLNDF